jgi:hypothetical protein
MASFTRTSNPHFDPAFRRNRSRRLYLISSAKPCSALTSSVQRLVERLGIEPRASGYRAVGPAGPPRGQHPCRLTLFERCVSTAFCLQCPLGRHAVRANVRLGMKPTAIILEARADNRSGKTGDVRADNLVVSRRVSALTATCQRASRGAGSGELGARDCGPSDHFRAARQSFLAQHRFLFSPLPRSCFDSSQGDDTSP